MSILKKGSYKVILPLFVIFVTSTVLLIYSITYLRDAFERLESARVLLSVKSCTQKGITLVFESSIEVITPGVKSEIEFLQLRVFSESGNYIGTWIKDRTITKDFKFSVSNVDIDKELRNRKVIVDGFAKVKLNIGRYGLRMNLPIQTEVIVGG